MKIRFMTVLSVLALICAVACVIIFIKEGNKDAVYGYGTAALWILINLLSNKNE